MRTHGLGNAQSGSFGAKQRQALEDIHQAYCISFPIKEPHGPARPAPLINQLMELQESTPPAPRKLTLITGYQGKNGANREREGGQVRA